MSHEQITVLVIALLSFGGNVAMEIPNHYHLLACVHCLAIYLSLLTMTQPLVLRQIPNCTRAFCQSKVSLI